MIVKLIIPRKVFNKENDDIKIIFLGNLDNLKVNNTEKFYTLLNQIEQSGFEDISNQDITFINNIIPGFKNQIGNVEDYLIKFIYHSIPSNINTRQLNIFILDLLLQFNSKYKNNLDISFTSLKRYGIIPYYYNISINKSLIVDIINYIFYCEGSNSTLSINKFINGLKANLYLELPEASIKDNSLYFEFGNTIDDKLSAIEYLSHPKLRSYLNNQIPNILSFNKVKSILSLLEEDNIKKEDIIKNYENYGCYFIRPDIEEPNTKANSNFINKLNKSIFTYDSTFTKKYELNQDLICNINDIYNNTIYVYLGNDINNCEILQMPVKRLFTEIAFKINDCSEILTINNENDFWTKAFINRNAFVLNKNYINVNRNIEKSNKLMDFMITINKQYWNKLTFAGYLNQPGLSLNLPVLFNNSKVSFYCPVIKFINNSEVQNYNVYLPFIKTLDSKIAKQYFNNNDILTQLNENIFSNHINIELKRLKYNKLLSYLLYKIILEPENPGLCLNIFIFETGYVILNINNTNNQIISQDKISKAFTFLDVIIKKIKTLFNIKKLELLNPEKFIILSSYQKNPKIYKSIFLVEQTTSIDINLNFKSYYVFQNFVKRIIEENIFTDTLNKQLLDIKNDEYQKDFYLFITRNKLKDSKNILPLLNNIIARNPNYKKTFLTDNEIRYLYTQTDGFFHKSNIVQYMFSRIEKIGTLTKKKEHELIKETAFLFNNTVEEIQNIFGTLLKLDIQGTNKFHYLCSFVIKTDIENKCFNILFQGNYNIDMMNAIITDINFAFNQLFTEIINEPYNSLETSSSITKNIISLDKVFNKVLDNVQDLDNDKQELINKYKVIDNFFSLNIDNKGKAIDKGKDTTRQGSATHSISRNKSKSISLIDLENVDLDMDKELEGLDLDMDLDMDFDIDIDFDALEQLEQLDTDTNPINTDKLNTNNKSKRKGDKSKAEELKQLELEEIDIKDIVGKTKRLTEAEYIKLMRRKFDSELYEPPIEDDGDKFKADDSCPKTERRIPFIVTKEQLKDFNPKAFNGYLKYRDNYYICPRLWDAKAEKPISVEDFIKNGMKSPYSDGELVINGPGGKYITDKYNVILRKPTTNKKWSDPELHKDWPEVFRHTEKEAYPGLTKGNKHPQKLCLPCCFSNKPDEFDPNKIEIQEIKTPRGYNACKQFINIDKGDKGTKVDTEFLKYNNYVSNQYTSLKFGRLGLLPQNIDILLNNIQDIFLTENNNNLLDNSNLFLRVGTTNNKEYNIIESIAICLNISITKLLNLIIDKVQPEHFIQFNNGSLVDEFYVGNELYYPYDQKDLDKFITFCKYYKKLFIYLNINNIDFCNTLIVYAANISTNTYSNKEYYANFQTDLNLLYKIYVSYYNYLKFINSPSEIKQIHHVIDIFIKPRTWLFNEGVNIIIFNKDKKSIKCGYNTNMKSSKCILLLEEEDYIYVPIIQVIVYGQYRIIRNYILELNNKLNCNSKQLSYFEIKKPQFKKSLSILEERLEQIIKLLYIKNQVCKFDLKIVNDNLFGFFKKNKIIITKQYTNFSGISGNIGFISFIYNKSSLSKTDKTSADNNDTDIDIDHSNNNLLILPIYNNSILKGITLNSFNTLNNDIARYDLTFNKLVNMLYNLPYISTLKSKKLLDSGDDMELSIQIFSKIKDFGYHLESVNIEKLNGNFMITGVYFANGLLMILKPEKFDKEQYNSLSTKLNARYKTNLNITNNILINYIKYTDKKEKLNTQLNLGLSNISTNHSGLLDLYEYGLSILQNTILSMLSNEIHKNKGKYKSVYDFFKVAINNDLLDDNTKIKIDKSVNLMQLNIIELYKVLLNTSKNLLNINITDDLSTDSILTLLDNINNNKKEYKLLEFKYEFLTVLKGYLNKKKTSTFTILRKSLDSILLNIINTLILDSKIRNDFLTNKLLDFKIYNTLYFENIINKDNYNPLKNFLIENNIGLICNTQELNYIIKNYLISKYKNEYFIVDKDVKESLLDVNNKLTLPKYIIEFLEQKINTKAITQNLRLKNMYNLEELSSLSSSSSSKSMKDQNYIISTVFNSKGLYNPNAQVGKCVFPYKNIRGKLSYNCNPANKLFPEKYLETHFLKDNDLICPTKINKQRYPESFGYCPEKEIITKDKHNIKPKFTIDTNKQCMFPYLFFNKKIINPLTGTTPLLKINFNCFKKRKEEGQWCFVNNSKGNELEISKNRQHKFLIGATNNDDIYYGIWSMEKILEDGTQSYKVVDKKKLKAIFELLNYKEERCIEEDKNLTLQKKIEKKLELSNINTISLDDYDHSFCMLSESKKGYSKKQLYVFGRDILGIPYTLLINKNNKILSKQELCKMFEPKIMELKKAQVLKAMKLDEDELDLKQIYTKDPEQCNKGEGKGGYKVLELRNMATTFLGLPFDKAYNMNKEQLCNYMIPKIFTTDTETDNTNLININNNINNLSELYPKNKDKSLCDKPVNRGGLEIKLVRQIANKLGIEYKNRLKKDVCNDIRNKLENIKSSFKGNKLKVDDKMKLSTTVSVNNIKHNYNNKNIKQGFNI